MIKPRLAGDTIRQISDGGPWKMVIGQARFADLVPCITTGHTDVDVIPPSHTRFWECEYCGTVNPIDTLDCRAKACGHSITRKAMEAAWEGKWDDNTAKWATENTKMAMGVDYGYEPDKTATVLYQYSKRNNMFNAVDKMLNTGWWHR
jgi:hypothetical protein